MFSKKIEKLYVGILSHKISSYIIRFSVYDKYIIHVHVCAKSEE